MLQTARRLKQLRGAIKRGVLDNRIDFVHLNLRRLKVKHAPLTAHAQKLHVPDFSTQWRFLTD